METITPAPRTTAVSVKPPTKKLGTLDVKNSGIYSAKILTKRCKSTIPSENMKASMALMPIFDSFTVKITTNGSKANMTNDPEVPSSNTSPTTDFEIAPENIDATIAIKGKTARGIRVLVLGSSIIPPPSTKAKKDPINKTMRATTKTIFTVYIETKIFG
jgi:hypothetical protein